MTVSEALGLLLLGGGAPSPEQARRAYVRRAQEVSLAADPEAFMHLREAFELLAFGAPSSSTEESPVEDSRRGDGPARNGEDPYEPYRSGRQGLAQQEQLALAREGLAVLPDSAEARWTLLSFFPYATRAEAFSILCQGAVRLPEQFADELLFHFPAKVPADVLDRASVRAGWLRQLLIADVHATQRRGPHALQLFQEALAAAGATPSEANLKLAARPLLSLHANGQVAAATSGFTVLKRWAGTRGFEGAQTGVQKLFTVIEELGRLGESLPLDLRQVAAVAAKRDNYDHAPYEARFATRLMKPRHVRKWRKRLDKEAPTLAKIFGLHLTEHDLRPRGIPNFRIAAGWGAAVIVSVLSLSWHIHGVHRRELDPEKFLRSLLSNWHEEREKTELEACAHPESETCRRFHEAVPVETVDPETRHEGTTAAEREGGDVPGRPLRKVLQ